MDSEHSNAPQDTAKQVDGAARLFDEHHAFIQATLHYFVKDPQEQEDIYQDLFIYFIQKPVPDNVQHIKSWLYCVILDRIRDWKRRQSRYYKRLQAYAQECPEQSDVPTRPSVHRDQLAAVFTLIKDQLTENQARAVLFRYQHHLEIEEIAQRMKIKPRTVSRYVSVGLKKIRALLNKDEKD